VSVKRTCTTPDSGLTHIPRSLTVGSVSLHCTSFAWSRLSAPVKLTTRYTTADIVLEIYGGQYERDRGIVCYLVVFTCQLTIINKKLRCAEKASTQGRSQVFKIGRVQSVRCIQISYYFLFMPRSLSFAFCREDY